MWFLGISYTGIEDSNFYLYYWIIVTILTIVQITSQVVIKQKIPYSLLISVFIIFIIIILFLTSGTIYSTYFNRFIGMSAPALILGANCAYRKLEKKCMFYIEYLIVFSMIPFIFVLRDMLQSTGRVRFVLETGGNAMNAGYAATVFFVYIIMLNYTNSSKFDSSKLNFVQKFIRSKKVANIILLILFIVIVATGSRGPIVAVFSATILLMLINKSKISKSNLKLAILMFLFMIILVYFARNNTYESLDFVFMRINKLIDGVLGGGLETASAGRDYLYNRAIQLFKENPLSGGGFNSFIKLNGIYTHNMILDVITNYGIIGLTIWISAVTYIFSGIVKRIRAEKGISPFFAVFSVEIIKLMFSSTYIVSYVFWFFIGYGISCRFDNKIL
jgi:O-antigen ligase